jgi:hypothetical protein
MAAGDQLYIGPLLSNASGQPIGVLGRDGRKCLFPVLTHNATPATAAATFSVVVINS